MNISQTGFNNQQNQFQTNLENKIRTVSELLSGTTQLITEPDRWISSPSNIQWVSDYLDFDSVKEREKNRAPKLLQVNNKNVHAENYVNNLSLEELEQFRTNDGWTKNENSTRSVLSYNNGERVWFVEGQNTITRNDDLITTVKQDGSIQENVKWNDLSQKEKNLLNKAALDLSIDIPQTFNWHANFRGFVESVENPFLDSLYKAFGTTNYSDTYNKVPLVSGKAEQYITSKVNSVLEGKEIKDLNSEELKEVVTTFFSAINEVSNEYFWNMSFDQKALQSALFFDMRLKIDDFLYGELRAHKDFEKLSKLEIEEKIAKDYGMKLSSLAQNFWSYSVSGDEVLNRNNPNQRLWALDSINADPNSPERTKFGLYVEVDEYHETIPNSLVKILDNFFSEVEQASGIEQNYSIPGYAISTDPTELSRGLTSANGFISINTTNINIANQPNSDMNSKNPENRVLLDEASHNVLYQVHKESQINVQNATVFKDHPTYPNLNNPDYNEFISTLFSSRVEPKETMYNQLAFTSDVFYYGLGTKETRNFLILNLGFSEAEVDTLVESINSDAKEDLTKRDAFRKFINENLTEEDFEAYSNHLWKIGVDLATHAVLNPESVMIE